MIKLVYLAIGGLSGTFARYFLAGAVYELLGTRFPYGTLVVNLLGCFIIGALTTIAESKFLLSTNLRVLLMIGFCGAFTTFSTFIFETSSLIRDGETLRAFVNVIVSVMIGFVVFRLGVFLGDSL